MWGAEGIFLLRPEGSHGPGEAEDTCGPHKAPPRSNPDKLFVLFPRQSQKKAETLTWR